MKSTFAAAALLATLAQAIVLPGHANVLSKRDTISGVEHTFYGYPDNSPPGDATAYDCGNGYTAGGSGTYDDPLTMATAPGEFDECEVVWDSYTHKYLIFQDTCSQCITDWDNGIYHIDIWTGDDTDGGSAQEQCEDDLTPSGTYDVITDPGADQTVNSGALWDGSCETQNVYP